MKCILTCGLDDLASPHPTPTPPHPPTQKNKKQQNKNPFPPESDTRKVLQIQVTSLGFLEVQHKITNLMTTWLEY